MSTETLEKPNTFVANTKPRHTWTFPNRGLKAIFDLEIVGQLSDGAWENSKPYNHWKFWSDIHTELGSDWKFERGYGYNPVKRTGYDLVKQLVKWSDGSTGLAYRMRAYYVDAVLDLGLGQYVEYMVDDKGNALTVDQIRDNLARINPANRNYKTTADWQKFANEMQDRDRRYWEKIQMMFELHPLGFEGLVDTFKVAYDLYSNKMLINDLLLIKKQMNEILKSF